LANVATANPEFLKGIRHVAVYVRKSRVGQDESEFEALEKHRNQLIKFVNDNKMKYQLFEEIVSGSSTERIEFNKVLNIVTLGAVDAIVVINWDRLGRNELDGIRLRKALQDTDTLVVQLDPFEIINLNDDGDFDKSSFLTFFATWEARQIKRRLKAGKIRGALIGKWVNPSIPMGYNRNKTTGYLQIDERGAAIYLRMVEMFLSGMHTKDICHALNREGVPSPKGGEWNDTVIRRALVDDVYTGTAIFGKAKYKGNGAKIDQPKENQIIVEHAHPAIITKEIQNQIIDLFNIKKRDRGQSKNSTHILSTLLKCPVCGSSLQFTKAPAGIWVTKCAHKDGLGVKCINENKGISVQVVTVALANILTQRRAQLLTPTEDNGVDKFAGKVKKLEAEITKSNKAIERILDLYEEGEIDKATYTDRKNKRAAQLDESRRQLIILQAAGSKQTTAKEQTQAIDRALEAIATGERSKAANNTLKNLIDKIVFYHSTKIELKLDVQYN